MWHTSSLRTREMKWWFLWKCITAEAIYALGKLPYSRNILGGDASAQVDLNFSQIFCVHAQRVWVRTSDLEKWPCGSELSPTKPNRLRSRHFLRSPVQTPHTPCMHTVLPADAHGGETSIRWRRSGQERPCPVQGEPSLSWPARSHAWPRNVILLERAFAAEAK